MKFSSVVSQLLAKRNLLKPVNNPSTSEVNNLKEFSYGLHTVTKGTILKAPLMEMDVHFI